MMGKIKKMLNREIEFLDGVGIIVGTSHLGNTVACQVNVREMDVEGMMALYQLLNINTVEKAEIFDKEIHNLAYEFNDKFADLCKKLCPEGQIATYGDDEFENIMKGMN